MEDLGFVGVVLLVVAVFLAIVGMVLSRRTKALKEQLEVGDSLAPELDLERPRPRVTAFHVQGEEAQVTFDVPLPPGDADPVLVELLLSEALEVVHDKQHSLPIEDITKVVVFAGRGGEPRRIGELPLTEPGLLPPLSVVPRLRFASIGLDALDRQFEEEPVSAPPELVSVKASDTLKPIGEELRIPKALDIGLRAQGIDPGSMTAAAMVRGILRLFGYSISPGADPAVYTATKAGTTTYVREDVYRPGDYPELDEGTVRSFMVEFLNAGADRGLLVSAKFAPFSIYNQEQREPRVRFVTRERLQKFIDSFSLD
ncbi:hypothetical protein BMS3Abin02_01676 [bacterium BMS3Abin02]|nr:hypothetical protein BMS3Abin02_01676 [bacterium BMS3Abin02]GBE21099.1 hypothetical protein BMS3Bbin01_00440 [bacterium BMS3Bbin01]HDK44901.1 hypothetical protein [Actinomycetota bacterium]HDL49036.1 hypothetical protein [Actinomycetota bacterium]